MLVPLIVYAGEELAEGFNVSVPRMVMGAPITIEPPAPVPAGVSMVASSLLALFQTVVKGPEMSVPQRASVVFQVPAPP